MRYKAQHLLPQPIETSRRKYEVRELDYSGDVRHGTVVSTFTGSGAQDSSMIAVMYSTDGDYLFLLGSTTNTIYAYQLCPFFHVDTANLDTSLDHSTELTDAVDFTFSSDGTTLYIVDPTGHVYVYTLSTPWDLSTATYTELIVPNSTLSDITSITLNANGEIIVTTSTGIMYNLSVAGTPINPGDMYNEGIYNGYTHTLGGTYYDFWFNSDGTKVYLSYEYPHQVEEYTLSIPYDLGSTLTLIYTLSTGSSGRELFLSKDGHHLAVHQAYYPIEVYYMSTPWTLSTATLLHRSTVDCDYKSVVFRDDGLYLIFSDQGYLGDGELTVPWNFDTYTQTNRRNVGVNQSTDLFMDSTGSYLYQCTHYWTFGDAYAWQMNLSVPWLLNPGFLSRGGAMYFVGTTTVDLTRMRVSADGTLAIIWYDYTDRFWYFTIGDGVKVSQSNPVGNSLKTPGYGQGGSTLYSVDTTSGVLTTYSMSEPYDPSDISKECETLVVGADDIDVASDGNNMAFIDTSTGTVYQSRIS